MSGSAGTGKTFVGLNLALELVLDKETEYEELIIVRSIVPTRDIGFLPGDEAEKKQAYAAPYVGLLKEILGDADGWNKLIAAKKLRFESTSFIRGTTFNNAIVLVDEMQNLNFHGLDSVITRVGNQCRFIMSGDYYQSDFSKNTDKGGILNFMNIVDQLQQFDIVEFTWKDIVRSDFVRDYIMTKEMLGIQ
jgi:phosphate starvation-inducible PhoH-like protein